MLSSLSRREFLFVPSAVLLSSPAFATEPPLTVEGVGDVRTPAFYRHDIGKAPARFHEPTAGGDGNIWTSPLDGHLWRYHAPTGQIEVLNLARLTGRPWSGLHLWPISHGDDIYLCTPSLPEMWVWHRDRKQVKQYAFPHKKPAVYGGFAVEGWDHLYFYDTTHAAVLKWEKKRQVGTLYPCPYKLSGTLYLTFLDEARREIWGSTYTGNDLVCFDLRKDKWVGHHKCPLEKATPTPGNRVVENTLFVSDHLNGRLVPFDVEKRKWGEAIPIPGFKKWFGYVSGGWYFRGLFYLCHSTWTGGNNSLDGEPHHFIGSWTVFDPKTKKFSRLDMPARKGEECKHLQADYCAFYKDEMYILAVNAKAPQTAFVLRSNPRREK